MYEYKWISQGSRERGVSRSAKELAGQPKGHCLCMLSFRRWRLLLVVATRVSHEYASVLNFERKLKVPEIKDKQATKAWQGSMVLRVNNTDIYKQQEHGP